MFLFLFGVGKLQRICLEPSNGKSDHIDNVVYSTPPRRLVPLLGKELG